MLVFSHKIFFIENEAALLYVTICAKAFVPRIQCLKILPLKSSVFVVHFSNVIWHGNEALTKGISKNEFVPLLLIFHLQYSKYRGVKICFYLCHYQNQNFSLVSHSYRSCSNRVALVSLVQYSCRSCLTRVALASLMSRSCRIHVARVWRSCCKLDYINSLQLKYHAFHIYHPSFNLLGGLMLQNQLKSISLLRGFSLRILTGKKHP